MEIDWVNSLLLFGVLQGILLAAALGLMSSPNVSANRLLALLVLVFSFDLFMEVVYNSGWYRDWPLLIGVETPVQFLYGPLLLIYSRLLIGQQPTGIRSSIWHFVPALFIGILWSEFYLLPATNKIEITDQLFAQASIDIETLAYWILLLVHVMIYSAVVLKSILSAQANLKDHYSDLARVNLKWLLVFICAIAISWLAAASQVFVIASGIDIESHWLMLPTVTIVLIIYLIGYVGFSRPKIFTGDPSSLERLPDSIGEDAEQVNYKVEDENTASSNKPIEDSSGHSKAAFQLSPERIDLLERKLNQVIEEQQIFLDPDLRLRTLSETLNVPEHHLTILFNGHFGVKFYDFINQRRIEFAQQLLRSHEHQNKSVLEIGYAAGFNSKSTFYSLFKNTTNQTPAQYRKMTSQ